MIVGGTGGLGRSMAKRMIQRGARHIVLLSRSGKLTDELDKLIQESRLVGASIYVNLCDVAGRGSRGNLYGRASEDAAPNKGYHSRSNGVKGMTHFPRYYLVHADNVRTFFLRK